jgi:hypothetical protein
MPTYNSDDFALAGLGKAGGKMRGFVPSSERGAMRRPLQIVGTSAAPTPSYIPPPPVVNFTPAPAPQSAGISPTADLNALKAQIVKLQASNAALVKTIQTATQTPTGTPTGLQALFQQMMKVRAGLEAQVRDLTTKLTKKTASEAALVKTIQTAAQPPAAGAAPTGLQQLIMGQKNTIAALQARVKQLGG